MQLHELKWEQGPNGDYGAEFKANDGSMFAIWRVRIGYWFFPVGLMKGGEIVATAPPEELAAQCMIHDIIQNPDNYRNPRK